MSSWIGYLINMKVSLVLNGKQLFYTATSKKIVATAHWLNKRWSGIQVKNDNSLFVIIKYVISPNPCHHLFSVSLFTNPLLWKHYFIKFKPSLTVRLWYITLFMISCFRFVIVSPSFLANTKETHKENNAQQRELCECKYFNTHPRKDFFSLRQFPYLLCYPACIHKKHINNVEITK